MSSEILEVEIEFACAKCGDPVDVHYDKYKQRFRVDPCACCIDDAVQDAKDAFES